MIAECYGFKGLPTQIGDADIQSRAHGGHMSLLINPKNNKHKNSYNTKEQKKKKTPVRKQGPLSSVIFPSSSDADGEGHDVSVRAQHTASQCHPETSSFVQQMD